MADVALVGTLLRALGGPSKLAARLDCHRPAGRKGCGLLPIKPGAPRIRICPPARVLRNKMLWALQSIRRMKVVWPSRVETVYGDARYFRLAHRVERAMVVVSPPASRLVAAPAVEFAAPIVIDPPPLVRLRWPWDEPVTPHELSRAAEAYASSPVEIGCHVDVQV